MEFDEAFTRAVKSVLFRFIKPVTVCVVKAVNKDNNTCDVEENGTGYKVNSVMLLAVADDVATKLVVYPKVGSLVSVVFLWGTSNKAQVIKYTEVDEINLRGNEFGGLGKTEKIAERLKRLEDGFDALQTKFNAHTHVLTLTSGTGTAAVPANQSAESMNPRTNQEYISNENVKHG